MCIDGYMICLLFVYKMLWFVIIVFALGLDIHRNRCRDLCWQNGILIINCFSVMRRLCVDLDGTFQHFMFYKKKEDYNNRIVDYNN